MIVALPGLFSYLFFFLYDAFDIPIITYTSREKNAADSPTYNDNQYEEGKQRFGNTYRKGQDSGYPRRHAKREEHGYMEVWHISALPRGG